MTRPTADDYAIAIVAACRETGEPPLCIDNSGFRMRARHYAAHAIRHCFRETPPHRIAVCLGVINPGVWWAASQRMCIQKANSWTCVWWSDEAYDRVIRAIQTRRFDEAARPFEDPEPRPVAKRTEVLKLQHDRGYAPLSAARPAEKTRLEQMLADAFANTAKMGEGK